jgi:hypothetical protein
MRVRDRVPGARQPFISSYRWTKATNLSRVSSSRTSLCARDQVIAAREAIVDPMGHRRFH